MRSQETPARPEDSSTYLARRRRNNEAARRCRERRRVEELLLELRAMELLQENQRLRAALCALYPGPRVTDWPENTVPVPPGGTGVTYRTWTAPPPATTGTPLPCHLLQPVWVMSSSVSSQIAGCPSGAGPAATAESPTRTLRNLPHKLRLKGGRLLTWDVDGDSGVRD